MDRTGRQQGPPRATRLPRRAPLRVLVPLVPGLASWHVPVLVAVAVLALVVPLVLLLLERRRWERSRALSESRFRALTDQVKEYAIFRVDAEGHIQSWGAGAERLHGFTAQEVLGRHFALLFTPEEVQGGTPGAELRQAHEEGQVQATGWRVRKDGTRFWAEVVTTRLTDLDGHVFGYAKVTRDLTGRMQAERALRESEERFRTALDEAPIGMALVGLDGRFLRVNRALCELVGYSPGELTGLTFQAITHPEDLEVDVTLAAQLARGELQRYQLAKRYLHRSGRVVDVTLTGSVVRDREGTPLYFIAQVEDVTARKATETALRTSEERLRSLFVQAPEGIFVADLQGRYLEVNPAACTLLGYGPEELRGKTIRDLLPRESLPRLEASRERLLQPGHVEVAEWELRRKDGTYVPVEVSARILPDGRWQAIVRDVSERKRADAEQQLLLRAQAALSSSLDERETLERTLSLVAERLADYCFADFVSDDREVRRTHVAHRDPARLRLGEALQHVELDRSRPTLTSRVLETGQPTLVERVTPGYLAALAQSEEHLRVLRAIAPTSFMAVPLRTRGRVIGALAFVRTGARPGFGERDLWLAQDLASRTAIALENARLYDTARRAIAARDDVLGVVAHDLRNPLNAVVMQAQLLRRRGGEPERRSQAPGEKIREAASRMNRIIQDLLDVSRHDAGQLSLEPARLSPREVLLASVETQQPLATHAGLALRTDLEPGVPDVWADRDRLLQVLENLVGNALKFTGTGGTVTVGAAPRDGDVLFWVADTGPGIAAEELPHLFDRFWQARRRDRRGAGLGLSIVKGLVEAHGGRIWVESTPGRGTTFFFTLPAFATARLQREASLTH